MKKMRSPFRFVLAACALTVLGLGLQSMRSAPPATAAEDKPFQTIDIYWGDLSSDCDFSLSVTYVDYPDADCEALYQICRYIDCIPVSAGTPQVLVPGAGTILQVDIHCGTDCTGPSTLAYACDVVCIRGAVLECCGNVYRVSGGNNGSGQVGFAVVEQ